MSEADGKLEIISRRYLGLPYGADGLVGGAAKQEVFVSKLPALDCVTFCEEVLASYGAQSGRDYDNDLRAIRYFDSEVDWQHRKHYFSAWRESNANIGYLIDAITTSALEIEKECSIIKEIPPHTARMRAVSVETAKNMASMNGNIVGFITDREGLDYFHCGFLFKIGENSILRHAAKSNGEVKDEDFMNFALRTDAKLVTLDKVAF